MITYLIQDEELVKGYLQGDEECLRLLIKRYQRKLFSYILFMVKDRALAEDIFQDTFYKVISTLKGGKYHEEGKFYPWVVRISRNLVIDHFRKIKKMTVVTDSDGNDLLGKIKIAERNREDEITEQENHYMLKKLINSLPPEQKEVLILRHYADLSFKEIADLTHVSINTSLGRMRYALINMRKMIMKYNLSV